MLKDLKVLRKISAFQAEKTASADPPVGACLAYSRAYKEDIMAENSEEEGKLLLWRSERSRIQRPHPKCFLGHRKHPGFYSK